MKYCLLFSLLLLTAPVSAQSDLYSAKTYSIGFKMRGFDGDNLNSQLLAAGRLALTDPIPMLRISQSLLLPAWIGRSGFFYSFEYGGSRKEEGIRSQVINAYGGNLGFAAMPDLHTKVLVSGTLALNYSSLSLRMYDAGIDSGSLQRYLNDPARDLKRIAGGNFGLGTGLEVAFPLYPGFYATVGGGYIVPFRPAKMKMDAGTFVQSPKIHAAQWDVHLDLMLALVRLRSLGNDKPARSVFL